eukprot:103989_1
MSHLRFETESLVPKQSTSRVKWTTFQCVGFMIVAIIITALGSNMDRIISQLTENNTTNNVDGSYDIIIIGAGSSGLFQAHFLQKQYPNDKILVIEQLNRTGGRQFSSTVSYKTINNTIVIEHCAMRFMLNHIYTQKLASYLGLCDNIIPWQFSDYNHSRQPIFSSRNNYIFENNIDSNYWINNYNLLPHEQLLLQTDSPLPISRTQFVDLITTENQQQYPPITEQGWYEFRNEWTLNGIVLNKWSAKMLFRYLNYSSEFQQAILDQGGAEITFDNQYVSMSWVPEWNLVNTSSNYNEWTFDTGYDAMTRVLTSLINENDPNCILFNNKVIGIDKYNTNRYTVKTSQDNVFITDKIILAIPTKHLQELLPNIKPLNNNKYANDIINSMDTVRYFCKMNLLFDKLLLLSNGKCCFDSIIDDIDIFFENAIKPKTNPADVIIFEVQKKPEKYADAWSKSRLCQYTNNHWSTYEIFDDHETKPKASKLLQYHLLLIREFKAMKRDLRVSIIRLIQVLFFALVCGMLYLKIDDNFEKKSRCFFLLGIIPLLFGMVSLLTAFPKQKLLFQREYNSGTYNVTTWALIHTIVETPR